MNPRSWLGALGAALLPSGSAVATLGSNASSRRLIAWLGGTFIAVVASLAAYDIVRSYHATIDEARVALDTQSRVIAEQTARTVQAVDTVLRHLVEQHRSGMLDRLDGAALHAYLQEQTVGIVQIDGLVVFRPDGSARAASFLPASEADKLNGADLPVFRQLRDDARPQLAIGKTFLSGGTNRQVIPMGRRLETAQGEFAGVVGAGGLADYFQSFYRDAYPDAGTRIALLYRDGTLLARHPRADAALGRRLDALDALLPTAGNPTTSTRGISPVDGTDRFASIRLVPDYPLVVVVTREASAVLAPWRKQATGSALRTLALAAFAAWLIVLAVRHLARLRESEERFAVAVEGSDDGIWVWNFVTGKAYASQRSRELSGFPDAPEVQTIDEWNALMERHLHPDDAVRRRAAIANHIDGRLPAYESEYRMRTPQGTYRWLRVRGMCVRDANGKPLLMAGSSTDIDARKRAEEALRVSEERYALAVEGANEGLWDWDLPSDRLFLSPRAQVLVWREASEPATRPRSEWLAKTVYHPDDIEPARRALSAHLRGETPHYSIEYRLRHHSGEWHWYRQRGIVVRDDQGRPYRMAGSMEDISPRKNAEAERTRLEQQLRQAQKLEAIGTLAGGIAHDFNNILSAILGYGEMAQKEAGAGTTLRRHIDASMKAALRAKSLVERILAFSRGGVASKVPVHVGSAVDEALIGIAASLPDGVQLERRFTAPDAGVLGDPTQVHQVVMNLCANAIHAMGARGVLTVSLDAVALDAPLPVTTSTLPAGHYVRLGIADTGSGMAPAVLERIFDPFFTTKEVGVGTGLGLSLVHGIVTDLGGGIDVDSRLGQGTRFTVYLPWHDYEGTPTLIDERVTRGAGETVLFVDDEEALVRLGEETLAHLGYEPVGYSSSIAALAAFREEPARFDAVLSDESMPDMTGIELVGEIRRLRPDIPVVLMSGYVDTTIVSRARAAGVATVLTKPLVSRDIARSLAAALRREAVPAGAATR